MNSGRVIKKLPSNRMFIEEWVVASLVHAYCGKIATSTGASNNEALFKGNRERRSIFNNLYDEYIIKLAHCRPRGIKTYPFQGRVTVVHTCRERILGR